jgi:hypothetical protein
MPTCAHAHSEAVKALSNYELLSVDGDGNCFFRAVVRAHLPFVSNTSEKRISGDLRRAISGVDVTLAGEAATNDDNADDNDDDDDKAQTTVATHDDDDAVGDGDVTPSAHNGESSPRTSGASRKRRVELATSAEKRARLAPASLHDFMEEGVDDRMTENGNWASHVQALQMAVCLQWPIALLHPEDENVSLEPRARAMRLRPAGIYYIEPPTPQAPTTAKSARGKQAAPARTVEPLSLLFSPWPGHYDAAVPTARCGITVDVFVVVWCALDSCLQRCTKRCAKTIDGARCCESCWNWCARASARECAHSPCA